MEISCTIQLENVNRSPYKYDNHETLRIQYNVLKNMYDISQL